MSYEDYLGMIASQEVRDAVAARGILLAPIPKHIAVASDGDALWMLMQDYTFELPGVGRTQTIHAGYLYDGASIRSKFGLAWATTTTPSNPWVQRGAMTHDVLCDIQPGDFSSDAAADLYGKTCLEDGVDEDATRRMVKAIKFGGPKWGIDD